MRTVQNLAQLAMNDYLNVGDLAIDASIGHGDTTRFLASRVGDDGQVLAFSAVKAEIDDVATSLFLSGLHDRVELLSKDFTAVPQYLDPLKPVGVAMFKTDADTDQNALLATIKPLLLALKAKGLILVMATDPTQVSELVDYTKQLPADSYAIQTYSDVQTGDTMFLLQRN